MFYSLCRSCQARLTYNLAAPQVLSDLPVAEGHAQHRGQVRHQAEYHIVPKQQKVSITGKPEASARLVSRYLCISLCLTQAVLSALMKSPGSSKVFRLPFTQSIFSRNIDFV